MFDLTPARLVMNFIVLIVAVAVHEFAHAYGAYLMGDTTAKEQGRMTLNPMANIWWPGFLIGVLGGFAILGSAPVNPWRMRNPKIGAIIATAAGPVSNLILAALFALPLRFGLLEVQFGIGQTTLDQLVPTPDAVITAMVWINLLLFFFNFIPLSPLDGWNILFWLLPRRESIWWERQRQTTMYILFGLILWTFFVGRLNLPSFFNILGMLIGEPSAFLFRLFTGY